MVKYRSWILLALLAGLSFAWLALTPPGLLGKADAIGYAFCHRIAERSFLLGERALPLCARCSGMYLGALAGFLYQLRSGRRGGLPTRRIQVGFAVFLFAFGLDGVNSYLSFFPAISNLYPPHNGLRLLTGTLLGTALAAVLVPSFHQVAWQNWDERPALSSFRQLLVLLALAGLIAGAIASENPLLVYPLALLSILSLCILLGLAYAMLWILLLKRENTFTRWRQLKTVLLLAALTLLLQIAAINAFRYHLTGTWQGLTF